MKQIRAILKIQNRVLFDRRKFSTRETENKEMPDKKLDEETQVTHKKVDTLQEFIKDNQEKYSKTIEDIKKLNNKVPPGDQLDEMFKNQSDKLFSNLIGLGEKIEGQLKSNPIALGMYNRVINKLKDVDSKWTKDQNTKAKCDSMKEAWKDICMDMTKDCSKMKYRKVKRKDREQIDLLIKTIINKGRSSASELKFKLEEATKKKR